MSANNNFLFLEKMEEDIIIVCTENKLGKKSLIWLLFQDFIYNLILYKALCITSDFTMLIKFHGSLCRPAL